MCCCSEGACYNIMSVSFATASLLNKGVQYALIVINCKKTQLKNVIAAQH